MKLKKAFNSIASVLLVVTMLMSLLPVGVFATEGEQNYDLRILTFEDEDYKGGINFAGGNNWSSLIDDSQYGGDLLYGGGMGYSTEEEAYKWHDEGNTELSSRLCQSYGAFAFWSGGHAISNYNTADIETYGDYQSQITVYKADVEELATTGGGHNGSDNFAVHYGYMDGSAYNMAEELPALSFADGKARVIDHMYINTTTYALNCCVNGNDLTASIGESDYVKVVATGYDGETVVGTVEKYIVNGPDEMILDWTKWDLSGLGEVTKVEFNMLGTSDNGYGFSQAAYFAYDDVAVRFEKEQNELPTLADGISATAVADVTAGTTYTVKLDDIFTDADGDILTYKVKINDASAINADANYSFTPDIGGEYVLVFTANDGKAESLDTYTITLNVTNPVVTYNTTVLIPEGITPTFYITNGYDNNKVDILGDELVNESGTVSDGFVPYTIKVPENIDTISIRAKKDDTSIGGMSIPVSASSTVTFRKVNIFVPTKVNDSYVTTEQVKIEVADKDGNFATVGASGTDADGISYYTFFLAATGNERLYTFYAKPLGDLTSVYASTQANNKAIFTGNSEVYDTQVELSYKNAFKLNVPADAEAKAFRQNKNYNVSELAPLEIQNESNGTKTYYFNVSSGSDSYSYRVSKEGKITKAGFISGTEKKVTWSDEDLSPNANIDYDKTTLFGSRGDDSLLLNVNEQNRLVLAKDETFKLRAYRVWQIINSDTANIMIEPDFNYNILSGSDIISITPVTSGNGNAKNNWLNITAIGEGTAILEIGYDALDIISGNLTTNNGLSEFTFGACDEARKGLVIVQTANAATDVNFGIKAREKWDAEFDTLYFTGEYATLDFLPTVTEGIVNKVEFSNDNGKTWTKLDKKDDNYTARIISGNNILKVTKDDGTTSYQVVRGDKITYTVSNVTNPGENLSAGDVARVTFDGIHFPMGKMSGIYNPGYIYGHKLTYTLGEAQVQTAGSFQYNFPANAYLDVTIPEDTETGDSFSLTDGYIYFNSMGSAPGEHRNITDEGVPADFHATSTYYSRSILPDITITLESNDVSGGDDGNDDGDTDGGTVGGNTGTTTKPDDDDIDVSNLKFDISGSEIKGYVTVSFEDFGKRKSGESGVVYKNALGEIIEEVEVPFKSRDTIATVTLRLLKALGIKSSYTGSATSNFYLSSIGNFTLNGKHYSSFGEFDAGAASGWMIKHNNWFINMGASEFTVQDGDKVEWLYTCQLGADIGCDWSNPSAEITGINFKSNYGTLSPSFSKDVTEYTYSVSSSTKSICLEAKQANYWAKVTYKSGDKIYRAMETIPVSDGTIITIESAFAEYAGDTPSDTDKITITIQKSSGGTSSGSISSPKDDEQKDTTQKAETTTNITGDKAIVTTTESNIKDAISKAEKENTNSIVISSADTKDATNITLEIPVSAAQNIAENSNLSLEVETASGNVSISNETLNSIVEQVGTDENLKVTVEITSADKVLESVSEESAKTITENVEKSILENAVIVEVNITSGDKHVRSFGGNKLTVDVPVDGKGHNEGKHYKVHIVSADGKMDTTFGKCVSKGGKLVIKVDTTHLSSFIVTDIETCPFGDVPNHWAYEAVKYVYANSLMQGTDEATFAPDENMTRAMLVTVLYRMANPEEKANNHNFADVPEGQWYSDAVAWAAENDIVSGVSENKFAPNEDITREQLALIIYRYAKIQGFDVTETSNLEGFNDAKDVSDWALDAIKWANSVTLVNGTSETTLSPKDTATRAQVAAILMRFCENIAK